MLITKIPTQLSHLLASARSTADSIILSIVDSLESVMGARVGNEQPNMALIPVSQNRCGDICGRDISAFTDIHAPAAVHMYANPVTKDWRVLTFGKTNTGKTGHSQPSRFAP